MKQLAETGEEDSFDGQGEGEVFREFNFPRDERREKEEGVEGPSAMFAGRVLGLIGLLPPPCPIPMSGGRTTLQLFSSSSLFSCCLPDFPREVFFQRHVIA